MSRKNPQSTGYVAAKIRANTARRNGASSPRRHLSLAFSQGREALVQDAADILVERHPGPGWSFWEREANEALGRVMIGARKMSGGYGYGAGLNPDAAAAQEVVQALWEERKS